MRQPPAVHIRIHLLRWNHPSFRDSADSMLVMEPRQTFARPCTPAGAFATATTATVRRVLGQPQEQLNTSMETPRQLPASAPTGSCDTAAADLRLPGVTCSCW